MSFLTESTFPVTGVLQCRAPKHSLHQEVEGSRRALVLPSHLHDGTLVGKVVTADRHAGSLSYFRMHPANPWESQWINGATVNPRVRPGDVILALGVPGFEQRGLPWMAARVTEPPEDGTRLAGLTPLWGPSGYVFQGESRGMIRSPYVEAWVRLVGEPPQEYLPQEGDSVEVADLRTTARGLWLRQHATLQRLRHAAVERHWQTDLERIHERAHIPMSAVPWTAEVEVEFETSGPVPGGDLWARQGLETVRVVAPSITTTARLEVTTTGETTTQARAAVTRESVAAALAEHGVPGARLLSYSTISIHVL